MKSELQPATPAIALIKAWMDETPTEHLSHAVLARKAGMNDTQLKRKFKAA